MTDNNSSVERCYLHLWWFFLTDISVMVAQIKNFLKTKCIYFRILVWGSPPAPNQLIPKPFNWSPNTVLTDIHCWVEPSLLLSSFISVSFLDLGHRGGWTSSEECRDPQRRRGSCWTSCNICSLGDFDFDIIVIICIIFDSSSPHPEQSSLLIFLPHVPHRPHRVRLKLFDCQKLEEVAKLGEHQNFLQ